LEELAMILLCLVLLSPAPDVVRTMTPAAVQQALKSGVSSDAYLLSPGGPPYVWISTPFRRVAELGMAARQKYQEIRPSGVPRDLYAPPVVEVGVSAWMLGESIDSPIVEIEHIVLVTRVGEEERFNQPTRTEEEIETWSNALGVARRGRGLRATFPLRLLAEGTEVRVVTNGREYRFYITAEFLAGIR
jgi:hypothetical protein